MAARTALITGATGLLGRQVLKAFQVGDWNAKGTGFSRADGSTILKLDLANDDEVKNTLESVRYDHFPMPKENIADYSSRPQVVVHCKLHGHTSCLRHLEFMLDFDRSTKALQTASRTRSTRTPMAHGSSTLRRPRASRGSARKSRSC